MGEALMVGVEVGARVGEGNGLGVVVGGKGVGEVRRSWRCWLGSWVGCGAENAR